MPIYEYACKKCDHTLDALQKISEEPLLYCPSCGEPSLKKLMSAPRFRLKGEGWYETDFKKDNQRNLASDKEPAPKKSSDTKEKSDTGKTEKSAEKPKASTGKADTA